VADRELRVVGERGADADHDHVDERPQPVQMGETGRPVDVVRVAGLGRDPAVERLTELTDHHEIVDRAGFQRSEPLLPGRGEGLQGAKHLRNARPAIGGAAVRTDAIAVEPEILRRERRRHHPG